MDVCLGRRGEQARLFRCRPALTETVVRDVRERGRDIDGVVKQWFNFVKPSYRKYVEPQRAISGKAFCSCRLVLVLTMRLDLIIPRGIENKTAIGKDHSLETIPRKHTELSRPGRETYPDEA